jgi:hypothetical protein
MNTRYKLITWITKKFETPMPLEKQMTVLSQIGFKDVECFWRYLNLTVFGAKK